MRSRVPVWILVLVAASLFLTVYLPRIDAAAGLIVDDAWYILLARALAEGQGYHLANSPSPGLLPPYPPGFAALLSVVFLVDPEFPRNIVLLKSLSIAAMFGVGIVSYRYFTRYRATTSPLALGLACATVVTPAFVFLATSTVMSECVFTLAQVGAVVLIDKSLIDKSATGDRHYGCTLLAAGLAAGTVLIRSAGVPLVAAIVLHLLTRRHWQQALLFCAAVLLCVAPWTWFARTHEPTREERLAHGGAHAFAYSEHFWLQWAGRPAMGTVSARELPARVKDGLIDVFARDIGAIVTPVLFRDGRESGQEVIAVAGGRFPASMGSAAGTIAVSLVLSSLAFLGFLSVARRAPTTAEFLVPLSIGMIVLWPHPAIRFVLPLTPFLFFYLVRGIQTLTRSGTASRIALLSVIGLNLLDHSQYRTRSTSRGRRLGGGGSRSGFSAELDARQSRVRRVRRDDESRARLSADRQANRGD